MSHRRVLYGAAVAAALLLQPLSVAAQGDAVAQAHLGLARTYRDVGNLAAAAAEFERADRVSPLRGETLFEYFWLALGRSAPAAERLGLRILREQPRRDDVRDALVGLAAARGDETTVMRLAAEGRAQHDARALWHRRMAESLLRQREFHRAAVDFEAAAAMPDALPEDKAQRAMALSAAGAPGAALAAWKEVPPVVRHLRHEWDQSWADAVMAVEPTTSAAERLQADLLAHADDEAHGWLYQLYIKAGDAGRALAVAERADNPARHTEAWARRRIDARWQLAAASAAAGDAESVNRLLKSLDPTACDERSLRVLDRLLRVELLSTAVLQRAPSCVNQSLWTSRVIERAVAEGQHPLALTVLDTFEGAPPDEIKRMALRGQLLLWSGRSIEAVPLLEAAVGGGASREVAESLVDALRAAGDPQGAWDVARSRLTDAVDGRHRLKYSQVALEGGDAAAAIRILYDTREAESDEGREVLGRAFLVSGRHQEARAILRDLPALSTREATAMAWLDTLVVTDGVEAALLEAERLAQASWVEVNERRVRWNERLGRVQRAEVVAIGIRIEDEDRAAKLESERLGERLMFASEAEDAGRLEQATGAAVSVLESPFSTGEHREHATGILEQLSSAHWAKGNASDARALAQRVMAVAPSRSGAWLIEAAAGASAGDELTAAHLRRFYGAFSEDPAALLAMANHVASRGERTGREHIDIALGWSDELLRHDQNDRQVLLTRARLLVTAERWSDALDSVERALRISSDREGLRLNAQILGWSGQWIPALEAYDQYLRQFPEDHGAQREAARIEGWRQAFGKSVVRYTSLLNQSGGDPVIDAELRSKRAYYSARWGAAAREYQRWTSLDPADSEAAFERAQVFEAAGDLTRARDAYASILARVPHQQTREALQRFDSRTRTGAQLFAAARSANGYDGLALITIREQGATVSDDLAFGARSRIVASGSRVHVSDASASSVGTRATVELQHLGSARWRAAARAGVLSMAERPTVDGMAALWLRLGDAWEARVGVERNRLSENLPMFRLRAMETAWAGALSWTSSRDTSVVTSLRHSHLFDGNTRRVVTVDARRRVLRGRNELMLLGRADVTRNARQTELYFSPATFGRADIGAEWRHWIRTPQFMSDRGSSMLAGYFEGADNRGIRYHSVSGGGEFRMPGAGLLVLNAQWVESRVYSSLGVSVNVQLLGPDAEGSAAWGSGLSYPR